MIINILRYMRGILDFYIEGAEPERLLNYCIHNSVEIIDPYKKNYRIYGKIHIKEYKRLKAPAKKFGLKIRIIKKRGLYFFARKNKIKIGFIFGIFFIIIFNFFMNCFIWEINIKGSENLNKEEILNSVSEMGLFCGTLSKKHFVQDIEWYLLRENKDFSSVEINIQGSVANIFIKEINKESEMVSDDDVPINIVASKYGVIQEIDIFDGQGRVKPGDAVMKGDLLVSAVYEDRHNKLTLKHARAHITAKTDYNIIVEFPFIQTYKTVSDKSYNTYNLYFLGRNFSIRNHDRFKGYPNSSEEKDYYFFGIKLPIKLITTRYFDVKPNSITYDLEQAKKGAFNLLLLKEEKEMKNMEIISKKIEEKVSDEKYIIESKYIVLMDIAKEQPIESDVPWKNTDDIS